MCPGSLPITYSQPSQPACMAFQGVVRLDMLGCNLHIIYIYI